MRLELSNKTELAKRAMTFLVLHADDQPLKGALLADWLETSLHYLPQVMKSLVRQDWVVSDPGPLGGYRATATARNVSMFQLIEAVEGPIVDGRCVLRGAACPTTQQCALHEAWSRARNALIDELQATPVVNGAVPSRAGHQHERETTRE